MRTPSHDGNVYVSLVLLGAAALSKLSHAAPGELIRSSLGFGWRRLVHMIALGMAVIASHYAVFVGAFEVAGPDMGRTTAAFAGDGPSFGLA
jgi:hypothetical protein